VAIFFSAFLLFFISAFSLAVVVAGLQTGGFPPCIRLFYSTIEPGSH